MLMVFALALAISLVVIQSDLRAQRIGTLSLKVTCYLSYLIIVTEIELHLTNIK